MGQPVARGRLAIRPLGTGIGTERLSRARDGTGSPGIVSTGKPHKTSVFFMSFGGLKHLPVTLFVLAQDSQQGGHHEKGFECFETSFARVPS